MKGNLAEAASPSLLEPYAGAPTITHGAEARRVHLCCDVASHPYELVMCTPCVTIRSALLNAKVVVKWMVWAVFLPSAEFFPEIAPMGRVPR